MRPDVMTSIDVTFFLGTHGRVEIKGHQLDRTEALDLLRIVTRQLESGGLPEVPSPEVRG